jgi:hypothetical protein
MSSKISMMAATVLLIGGASLANAAAAQRAPSQTALINGCVDMRGSSGRACLSGSCAVFDVAHGQRTVGPTVPADCQQTS